MTNKISGYSTTEPVVPVKGSSSAAVADKSQTSGSAAAAPGTQTADQLTLTTSARSLQQLESTIANTPVVNTEKVAAVRQQLSSGLIRWTRTGSPASCCSSKAD